MLYVMFHFFAVKTFLFADHKPAAVKMVEVVMKIIMVVEIMDQAMLTVGAEIMIMKHHMEVKILHPFYSLKSTTLIDSLLFIVHWV